MERPKVLEYLNSKHKCIRITCLQFFNEHLLAGQSGDLLVFKLLHEENQFPLILRLEVFSTQNIYGIVAKDYLFLIFGGKNVSVLSGTQFSDVSIASSWTTDDWILDGIWSDNDNVILLTAHNALMQYSYSSVNLLRTVNCVEQCILYSGKILGSKWDDLVVLAGTVYQEVAVWAPICKEKDNNIPVLHNLKGHKGVIFSIAFDQEGQYIGTTSDDRSVRLWSVEFSGLENTARKWEKAKINLVYTVFVHLARVWRAVFTSKYLVTIGEDSQVYLLNKGDGSCADTFEHNGEMRCLAHYGDYIAVGGNGINLRSISCKPTTLFIGTSLSDVCGKLKQVFFNKFKNHLAYIDSGLIEFLPDKGINTVNDERFASYCVMAMSSNRCYVLLGSITGDLVLYKVSKDSLSKEDEINLDKDRIYSLAWADCKNAVSSGENGCLSLINIKSVDGFQRLEKVREFTLPSSKERWINCALLIDNFLICGDRMGSLHLYSLNQDSMDPLSSLLKIHGTKGVTDLKYIKNIIHSIGRDGYLREISISIDTLQVISTLRLPMDWADSIIETQTFGTLIAGFKQQTQFVLWSVEEGIILFYTECGGGHKSFDYMFDNDEKYLDLCYLKNNKAVTVNFPLRKHVHKIVQAGYHRKTINTACLLSSDDKRAIVLTGSEDNSLNIGNFGKGCVKGHWTYVRHISAVRVVKCLENVVVSAGARAQLIVWNTHKNSAGELCLKEIKSHQIREDKDLRRSWKEAVPLVDPETRYMDVEVVKLEEEETLFIIFGVCSDGVLRIFHYNQKSQELELKENFECEQGCLLKINSYNWSKNVSIITGGTQGTVAFWHHPFDSVPSKKHSIHSSGINAMDHVILGDHLVLGTGGDDTSIVLSVFSLGEVEGESLVFSIAEHVHTCQISGLKITQEYVLTAALDQKLCLFRWSFDGKYLKTTFLRHFTSSIPDIHGISVWPINEKDFDILLYGCGFQVVCLKRLQTKER